VKAITLRHPWPWAILAMGKRIENRTWEPKGLRPGDRFAIHGGRVPRPGAARDRVRSEATYLLARFGCPPGVEDVVLAVLMQAADRRQRLETARAVRAELRQARLYRPHRAARGGDRWS
jgi:hypothetical protein